MKISVAEPVFGIQVGKCELKKHSPDKCAGNHCVIHNPSDHIMRDWEMNYRADVGLTERLCPRHGVGHPDPDDLAWHISEGRGWMGVHGCCGCERA